MHNVAGHRPYSLLAEAYDDIVGRKFFLLVRDAFEHIVARHRIGFASVADLGCGTGLFARYLNRLWRVPVFGVDISPAMLRVAASNCRGTKVTLLRQDLLRLALPRPVDLITANFDTVNHLVGDGDLPRLFRRLVPPYPEAAAQGDIEAIVDVFVDLDAVGEVTRVEIARWAGFGLDESTVETVRRLHFFPALRNGTAVPIRVLLRYNFRKPKQ